MPIRSLILPVVAPIAAALLAGCSGSAGSQQAAFAPTFLRAQALPAVPDTLTAVLMHPNQTQFIYVTNALKSAPPYTGAINYYPTGSNGDIAPSGVITGANTQLTQNTGLVVESNGWIYAANADTNSIVGFQPNSTGNVMPGVVITGSNTGLASPLGLALDGAGDIFVANCGTQCNYGPSGPTSIEEFAPGSNGNVAPVRTITGSRTQLGQADGIAVDEAGYIYVGTAAQQAVTVYRPHARGNAAPIRVISGPNTRIDGPDDVAVDAHGIYVTAISRGYIERFPRRGGGNVPPSAILRLNWQQVNVVLTAPDLTIYMTGIDSSSTPLIAQYTAKAHGHAVPLTVISGPSTQLVNPTWVYVR
jgi:hypothetical protein